MFLAAAVGLGAYAAGDRERGPLQRVQDLVAPGRGLAILTGAVVTLVLVMLVIASAALPGEAVYILKQLFRTYSIPLVFGFVFGLGLGIWVNYFVVPDGLMGKRARTIHRRWGLGLLTLFLTGVLYGPIDRLLPRLSGISTPAVSLDFEKGSAEVEESRIEGPGRGSEGGGSQSRTLGLALGYLNSVRGYAVRDGEYVRHLHGGGSRDWETLEMQALPLTVPIAACLGPVIWQRKYVRDAGAVQAAFGLAVSDGAAWFRSVLAENEKKSEGDSSLLVGGMYEHLAECGAVPPPVTDEEAEKEALELPYFALTLAHMMQLAGHEHDGAEILARWIDRSLRSDLREKIANWYRIRAYVHLSILLEGTGRMLETRDVLGQGVKLFEEVLWRSPMPELRYIDRWAKSCGKSRRAKANREVGKEILHNIRFTFMSLSNRWIAYTLDGGRVTAAVLKHAERNTAMLESCYPKALGDTAYSRAGFLVIHARLLMALAARKYFILPEGGKDLESYRDAREHLLRALALLRPLEDEERAEDETRPAGHVVDGYSVGYEVKAVEGYLRRSEAVLGLR